MQNLPPPDELLPYLLFSIPWFMALYQVYRGLTAGEMREYLRSDYSEGDSTRPPKYLSRKQSPVGFWCLFAFYGLILIVIPLGMVYAINHRSADPRPNEPATPARPENETGSVERSPDSHFSYGAERRSGCA